MSDLCDALGAVCVIDLHVDNVKNSTKLPPEYFADLVEYMHGDASTEWGKVRIADGHPEPYKVTYFELGNEMYNPNFAKQVVWVWSCVLVCVVVCVFACISLSACLCLRVC